MVTPKRHFFTERRMKERSGCGHTTEDFFHRETIDGEKWMWSHHRRFFHRETVEGEKWMWSHQGNPNKQKVKKQQKTALFNWTTQNL